MKEYVFVGAKEDDGAGTDAGAVHIYELPPTTPTNLTATPSEGQIALTWDANNETDFLRYRVYWDSSINPTTVHASREGADDTTFTVIGLTDGVEYYFRVTAVDSALNESGLSNEVSAVFQAATPGAVTPYTSDANTVLLDHFDGSTTATYKAFEYPGITSVTPNYIYGTGPGGLDQALTLHPPVDYPLYSSTYLQYPGGQLLSQPNGTVELWVFPTAYGTWMVEQGPYYGAPSGWTFGLLIDATGHLNAQAWAAFDVTSSTTVPLNTWTHVAATWGSTGAKLYINGELVGSVANTGKPASGFGGSVLVKGNWYPQSIVIDELRISNVQRTEFNVPLSTPPTAPILSNPGDGAQQQNIRPVLSWNDSPEADSYHLQVATSAVFSTLVFDIDSIAGTSRQVGPLASGQTYYWRVRGENVAGLGDYSTEWSFTTRIPLDAPAITIVDSFDVPGSSPTGLAWDGSSLWMIDNLENVYQLDTTGAVLSSFASSYTASGLTWDGDHLWLHTTGYKLVALTPQGDYVRELDVGYHPYSGMAWDGRYFWVGNYNNGDIHKHNPDGSEVLYFTTGFFGHPTGMDYNGGYLLIGDSFELYNRIYKYSTTGQELTNFNLNDVGLTGDPADQKKLAWDGRYLWYSSDARFKIYKLSVPYYHAAPAAPTLLAPANGAEVDSLNPLLSWNPSQDATSYQLQVANNPGFAPTFYDQSGLTITAVQVETLSENTTYYWRVQARNSAGTSSYSSTWSFAVIDAVPPEPPQNLMATPGDRQVTLIWSANSEPDLAAYNIYRDGSLITSIAGLPPDTTLTDDGPHNGLLVTYSVTAVDTGGHESIPSDTVSVTPVGLVAWYPFNGNANDESSNDFYHGSVWGAGLTSDRFEKVFKAYNFNGADDYISANTNFDIQALSFWFRTGLNDGSNNYIMGQQYDSSVELGNYNIYVEPGGTLYLNVALQGGVGSDAPIIVNDNTWHHAVFLSGDEGIRFYVDNEHVGGDPGITSVLGADDNDDVLMIGRGGLNDVWHYFTGDIDDIRIYNRTVSLYEIRTLFLEGPPLAPTGLTAMAGDQRIGLRWNGNTEQDLSHYRIYQGGMASFDTTEMEIDRVYPPDSTYIATGMENGTLLYYRISAVDSTGNISAISGEVSATPMALPRDGLVAWWPFSGDARDWSERNNHGTALGGAIPAVDRFGIQAQAFAFDGVDDYIHFGDVDILDDATAATISLWVNYSSHSGDFDPFLAKGSMAMNESYTVGAYNGTTPRPNVRVEFGQATAVTSVANTSDQLDDGQWHHVVAVLNAGVATLYKDGTTAPDLVHETNNAGYIKDDTDPLVVAYNERTGDATEANRWFGGMIDDIRIYDRALSLSEIQALYQESGLPPYDMFPPDAPADFNADEGIGQVYMHWTANSEVDLDHYQLYRNTLDDDASAEMLVEIDPPQVDYLDTNVVDGTPYWYWISALDTADNESGWSGPVPATPQAMLVPEGLVATPGDGEVTLKWVANMQPNLSHYLVYQSTTGGFDTTGVQVARVNQPSTSAVIAGLSNGVSYYFKLVALNDGGGRSQASEEVSAMPVASVAGEYLVDANTVGLWHFNESGGNIWYDASGNGNHGQAIGASSAGGVFGQGRSLASAGERIWVPHDPVLNPGADDFTVEIWLKLTGSTIGGDNLVEKIDALGGYFLFVSDGVAHFEVSDGSTLAGHKPVIHSSKTVDDGMWHHIAGMRDDGMIKLYVDGNLVGAVDASQVGSISNNLDLEISAWPFIFDEFRLSSVVRTAEELLQYYERAMPPGAPQDLTAEPGDTEVTLSWSANPEGDLSHYLVYQGLTSGFDTTGAKVAKVNHPDTTVNLTGLDNATTYYYRISVVDIWGMISEISSESSAEPRAYPTLQAVTDPELPLGWYKPTVSFAFSHSLDSATVTSSSVVVGDRSDRRVAHEILYSAAENMISVAWSATMVSLDTITITLLADDILSGDGYPIDGDGDGVAEGSPEDDIVRTYTISPYADFDTSGTIDFDDLARFAAGWYAEDFTSELGPAIGTVPHLIITPDNDFNLRDLMTFIRMWDWYSPSAAPLAKVLSPAGDLELRTRYAGQYLWVGLSPAVRPAAVHLQLTYANNRVRVMPDSLSSSYSLHLQRVWPGDGILEIDAALPSESATEPELPVHLEIHGRDPISLGIYLEAVDHSGNSLGSVEEMVEVKPVPTEFALHQNYPNPFNPTTTINYDLPAAGDVTLIVYDLLGREVIRLVDESADAGYYQTVWRGRSASGGELPSGIYLIRLTAQDYSRTIKSLLLK